MKNRPAKNKLSRYSARVFIDMGLVEIDPRLAELLLRVSLANSVKRLALEQSKLQRYLVGEV